MPRQQLGCSLHRFDAPQLEDMPQLAELKSQWLNPHVYRALTKL